MFPLQCFQTLPGEALASGYDELIKRSQPIKEKNESLFHDPNSFVFLRRHDHPNLKYFLHLMVRQ